MVGEWNARNDEGDDATASRICLRTKEIKKKNEIKLIDLSLARKVLSLWILMIDTITIVTNFLRGRESRRGSS